MSSGTVLNMGHYTHPTTGIFLLHIIWRYLHIFRSVGGINRFPSSHCHSRKDRKRLHNYNITTNIINRKIIETLFSKIHKGSYKFTNVLKNHIGFIEESVDLTC